MRPQPVVVIPDKWPRRRSPQRRQAGCGWPEANATPTRQLLQRVTLAPIHEARTDWAESTELADALDA